MTTQHTPGPWKVEEVSGHERRRYLRRFWSGALGSWRGKDMANAHLIAAAPDMYAALVGLQGFAEQAVTDIAADIQAGARGPNNSELARWSAVGSAIAKAEGRS